MEKLKRIDSSILLIKNIRIQLIKEVRNQFITNKFDLVQYNQLIIKINKQKRSNNKQSSISFLKSHQSIKRNQKNMNVHGIRDINGNQNNNRGNRYHNLNINDSIPFMNSPQDQRPPLQETIPYTIKSICCPTIRPLSISVILSVILVVLYVICCFQGVTKQNKNILEVDPQVLLDWGAVQDRLVKKGQVWRLLTASLLHINLLHIVMNMICLVFLLSRLQKTYHPKLLLTIIFCSAIAGNILSVLCNKPTTISSGASGIIFGVIGTYLSFMTINWQTLGQYGDMRSQLCCTIGILVFFSILFSFGSDVDMYGHFGGIIGGYLVGLAVLPGIQEKSPKFIPIGWSCFGAYILITFLTFFLTD